MSLSRRDFIKVSGISIASLLLTHCQLFTHAQTSLPLTDRLRLRQYWLSFDELASVTKEAAIRGDSSDTYRQQLSQGHRQVLNTLVATGEITSAIADLIQEAYEEAVFHVWRSNAPITCYEPMIVDYAPLSANILLSQAEALDQIAENATIEPATLEKARMAIEHDMAFYAMTDDEVIALYDRLVNEWKANGNSIPDFESVDMTITPDAETAARFLIDVLVSKE